MEDQQKDQSRLAFNLIQMELLVALLAFFYVLY
jgi:hypothetical protein